MLNKPFRHLVPTPLDKRALKGLDGVDGGEGRPSPNSIEFMVAMTEQHSENVSLMATIISANHGSHRCR